MSTDRHAGMSTEQGTDVITENDLQHHVEDAIRSVDDPEYPGVSIVDLGLLETLHVSRGGAVTIGLIPTFSGCPALDIIAEDTRSAVREIDGVRSVSVEWLRAPAWSTDRVSDAAAAALGEQFTVAVQIGSVDAVCPRCGAPTTQLSLFGPSRCRAVHRCTNCTETVEVMRG